MDKPTLEEQIAVSKLKPEECRELLRGNGLVRFDKWVFSHFRLAWRIIHWNWFDL